MPVTQTVRELEPARDYIVIPLYIPGDEKIVPPASGLNLWNAKGRLNRKTGVKGDLYLKANIVLPKVEDLDEDLVKILEEKLPSN